MKTMTCNELHGACDAQIQGETPEEMMANSQKHGMDMAAKGDQAHIKVMEEMKQHMGNPDEVKQFMDQFHKDFAAKPEDQ